MLIQPKELRLVKVVLLCQSFFCEGGSEIIRHMHFKTHSVEVCVGHVFGQGAARWRWVGAGKPIFHFLMSKGGLKCKENLSIERRGLCVLLVC